MSPIALLTTILSLEPAIQELIASALAAHKANDQASIRRAYEAAIVLQFEARKA